jgi:phosphopantothenoylcysteine decarboxylase/phosphopantothenate--cysteine ligase
MLKNKEIVHIVTGGIAAYKSVEILRELYKFGANIRVIMTSNAQKFITPLTFQTLSGNPVILNMFNLFENSEIPHVSLADRANLVLIAPATANIIGKVASGIADDLPTTLIMSTKAPVLFAPAMNVNMYNNPILKANVGKLQSLGYYFVEPEEGPLACKTYGVGRLAETERIIEKVINILTPQSLSGKKVLLSAGPTQESIDPVRFISNHSSGKMGYALAREAVRRGAKVTLISGPVSIKVPFEVDLVWVKTAKEMEKAMVKHFPLQNITIKVAAVSDFRPLNVSSRKIKKTKKNLSLTLTENPDILKKLGNMKKGGLLIGFAAETEDLLLNAKKKLKEKNLDMIIANPINITGAGFESDTNIVNIITSNGNIKSLPVMDKERIAQFIWDEIILLKEKSIV